jgi:hypothetical protein
VSRASDQHDRAIVEALSGDVVAATRHQLRELTGLSDAQVRSSLSRLRSRGTVTAAQRAPGKPVLNFLAGRTEEAARLLMIVMRGAA